jgi:flagellar basal body-associated protein FliL
MKLEHKQDKGVAGLTILLSLVVMLFVIGLLVMIFAIMSGKMVDTDTLYDTSDAITVTNEKVTQAQLPIYDALSVASYRDVACSIVAVYNSTVSGIKLTAGNYTEIAECKIKNLTSEFVTTDWAVNYTYTYSYDKSGAVGTINDTASSISSVTDWFDIFVVIGAMVVLILLTVVIISAINSSGMVGGANQQGANSVGTA